MVTGTSMRTPTEKSSRSETSTMTPSTPTLETRPRPVARTHDFVIVANRLPMEHTDLGWRDSPGGLVRALVGLLRERHGVWVGWTGAIDDSTTSFELDGLTLEPISLDSAQVAGYYEGISNGALWPLYHDAIRPSIYEADSWLSYRAVNDAFAERAAAVAAPGATVWVHDYHLQLVPSMLRARRPDLRIGFFLHIPFPPQELFMRLPWRDEVIEGLMGADVIGFQRTVAAENFVGLANRLLNIENDGFTLRTPDDRIVEVGAFPISIDVAEFDALAATADTERAADEIRARLGRPEVVMLGVDRLDYTKGIEERLVAFRSLLTARRPHRSVVRPPIVLIQVAVPSRETVGDYQAQRERVEQLVGAINGEFATLGHPAVHYLHQGLPLDELVALYRAADVMVVTPLRDGMNLVAKEFVASRPDEAGVLVLSEFAGAVDELSDSVVVNPHDPDALVEALATAIDMGRSEAAERMRRLRVAVAANDVHSWAASFLGRLAPANRHPDDVDADLDLDLNSGLDAGPVEGLMR
jgi:trehalose 6-phosphate synthase